MRPETRLQRDIRRHLDKMGLWSVHVPNGAVLSGDGRKRAIQMQSLKADGLCPGFPDLIVFDKGRIGFIEVKCEGEYASDTQMEVEHRLSSLGFRYAVCRSVLDIDETLAAWGWLDGPKAAPKGWPYTSHRTLADTDGKGEAA